MKVSKAKLPVLTCLIVAALAACGGGSSGSTTTTSTPPPPTNTARCNAPTNTETYTITFTSRWSGATHPGNFPAGAHFSPLVGAVHKTDDIVWTRDGTSVATDGIESMAETGATTTLRAEIASYIANGDASTELVGSGISATDTTQITATLTTEHHLISLVSMIAPSPDWFVGARNIALCQNDQWVNSITVQLNNVYDSGTDSGRTFASPNADVTPHLPVRLVSDEGNHFLTMPLPLAELVFTRNP